VRERAGTLRKKKKKEGEENSEAIQARGRIPKEGKKALFFFVQKRSDEPGSNPKGGDRTTARRSLGRKED